VCACHTQRDATIDAGRLAGIEALFSSRTIQDPNWATGSHCNASFDQRRNVSALCRRSTVSACSWCRVQKDLGCNSILVTRESAMAPERTNHCVAFGMPRLGNLDTLATMMCTCWRAEGLVIATSLQFTSSLRFTSSFADAQPHQRAYRDAMQARSHASVGCAAIEAGAVETSSVRVWKVVGAGVSAPRAEDRLGQSPVSL
jgi:hypothetical protein